MPSPSAPRQLPITTLIREATGTLDLRAGFVFINNGYTSAFSTIMCINPLILIIRTPVNKNKFRGSLKVCLNEVRLYMHVLIRCDIQGTCINYLVKLPACKTMEIVPMHLQHLSLHFNVLLFDAVVMI